jgi:GNAT superfamily N-acetyltransferase
MQRAREEDYERVQPVLAGLAGINLHISAVLNGMCPGEVDADDLVHPRTAFLTSGDACYLAGWSQDDAFNTALNATLPRDHYFVLFCDPGQWEGALAAVLEGTYAIRAWRRYYTLASLRIPGWRDRVPDGFSMRRASAELLASDLRNRNHVVGGILDGWRSVDAFVEHGFGSCLVHDGTIVSWSLVDYVDGDRCEIGINTDWDFRRQGLGTLTAAANVEQAIAQGFSTIGWHCWANNAGSTGVAENVGFQRDTDYEVFINHWAAENVSDMSQDEFQAFAQSYERWFEEQPPTSGFPHIVAAKAQALGGNRPGCFRHLNRATDLGWLCGVDHLREIWPEFFWNASLDQMPEWQDLARRLEANE